MTRQTVATYRSRPRIRWLKVFGQRSDAARTMPEERFMLRGGASLGIAQRAD